jgi:glutamate racemase
MQPIGVFDSGYGGLTILKDIIKELPQYDYLYLGDNARSPYGTRSFETIYKYTWQAVQYLLAQGCPLVVVACNTASAKALRSIQQNYMQPHQTWKRVLGVIRPTAEIIGTYSQSKQIGIMATKGTVNSESYIIEIEKHFADVGVHQMACPLLVPLIENYEHQNAGADYFIQKYVQALKAKNKDIDTILLACTHYPIIQEQIQTIAGAKIKVYSQGQIVAKSLKQYFSKHLNIESAISKNGVRKFLTTDNSLDFNEKATVFFGEGVESTQISLQ